MAAQRSGWVTFSWIIFLLAGLVNLLFGAAALVRKEYFPTEGVLYNELQSHGWIWLLLGLIQVLVALSIYRRMSFGLMAGLTLAVLAALMWFFYMLYIPNAGFALVVLYALVIYGLAAHPEEFTG